jgi:hypothetical protein
VPPAKKSKGTGLRPRLSSDELIARLGDALAEFRQELEAVGGDPGPNAWPTLTDGLRAALHRVRELRNRAGTAVHQQTPQIPPLCNSCGGHGMSLILLGEAEGPNWCEQDPCRPCLTTGFDLNAQAIILSQAAAQGPGVVLHAGVTASGQF